MKKTLYAIMLATLLGILFTVSVCATEIVESGSLGGEVTYTLGSDGLLTVSGNGKMTSYLSGGSPLYSKREQIKSLVVEDGITALGNYVFEGCINLTSVSLPDTLIDIGEHSFLSCKAFVDIVIPDSVTRIRLGAFTDTGYYNDSSNWENTVLYIGKAMIRANTTLTGKYSVKSGTTVIADEAFEHCEELAEIVIPDSVTSIGDYAFSFCQSLTSVKIGSGVKSIGAFAFSYCSSLKALLLPDCITYLGDYLFYFCRGLEVIVIPDSVTALKQYTFQECTNLKAAVIPTSVTSIGFKAFFYCKNVSIYGYRGSAAESYAQSERIPFVDIDTLDKSTITYDANGGENAPASQVKINGITIPVTTHVPARVNHEFEGWALSANGDVVYKSGDAYSEDGDAVLYAVWESIAVPGDSNGDGVTNMKDSLILRKFLAGWAIDVISSALDINDDGVVNMKDALLLRKYLAGWNVELFAPSYVKQYLVACDSDDYIHLLVDGKMLTVSSYFKGPDFKYLAVSFDSYTPVQVVRIYENVRAVFTVDISRYVENRSQVYLYVSDDVANEFVQIVPDAEIVLVDKGASWVIAK